MCDCGWDKRDEVTFSTLEGERDVARADAAEAERSGLVSRVVPAGDLLTEATAVATAISQMSRSASRMAKEAVNRAFESSLAEGLIYERRLFHSAFATDDQSEGMAAFSEKRPPDFTHR